MCGINGFTFADSQKIAAMNARIKHRGPDDDGVFVEDGISLGNTRLAILDLSPAGHQPMLSDDGLLVLVFNGEIYNFQEVRISLAAKGYTFRSHSDSEVILQAYKEYGPECVQYFNGIFAFAIWDKRQRQLFIARDRLGVKPLYYAWDGEQLIFSSELKALLVHPIRRTLNHEALNIYIRMLYVPAPLTMLASVKKLPPACYLVFRDGKILEKKYWDPTAGSPLADIDEARREVRRLVDDAVRLQLISDRPVGVFLSGGIDSTIITALAQRQVTTPLKTFSVAYDIAPEKFNADASLAKQTSALLGTEHYEFLVTGADCAAALPRVVYHLDEPIANATQVATYLLAKYTRKHVVVALGGDGGDELFGGYERYRFSQLITRYQRLPAWLRTSLAQIIPRVLPSFRGGLAKMDLPRGIERYLGFMAQKEADVAGVLNTTCNNVSITPTFYQRYFVKELLDPELELMWADIQSWLPDESLVRSDKMSMAWGVEQRVPLLDHRLVELALRIPTKFKIAHGNKKVLLKDACADLLPQHVLTQPKRGWFSPTSEWMRTALKDMITEVLSSDYNADTRDLFNFSSLQNMWQRHLVREAYHMNLLWAVVSFQIWYREFIFQWK